MSNFPTSLDDGTSLPNPSGTNNQNNPDHAAQHSTANDAIKAIEAKVGIGATTPTANKLLFGTGTGTTAWQGLTSAQLLAILSDETGTGSAVFATTPTLVTPKIDTINENTPGNGTTIGGVNIRSGALNTNNSVVTANITDSAITTSKINAGGVTSPKITLSYGFSAYSTTAQNTGNAAFALTNFQLEEFDIGSNFASSTFTAPVTANYHFDAHVATTGTPTTFIISLFKNGAEFKRGNDIRYSANVVGGNLNVTIRLNATDTADIRTFGNAAVAIDATQANCYFMGHFVGN